MHFVSFAALLVALACPSCPAQTAPPAPRSVADAWDAIARRHVDAEGRVDYAALRSDPAFGRLIVALSTFDPKSLPNDRARLAFWINAYNALTIHGVIARLPQDPAQWPSWKPTSISVDGESFWKGVDFAVAKRTLSLDAIEHEVIRGDARYRDPRIHVALVCAARGCPPLMNRAYRGPVLNAQLDDRMKREMADPKRSRWDPTARRVELSQVFKWYGKDFVDPTFAPRAEDLGSFLSRYVTDAAMAAALAKGQWTIGFYEYDWRLNLQPSR